MRCSIKFNWLIRAMLFFWVRGLFRSPIWEVFVISSSTNEWLFRSWWPCFLWKCRLDWELRIVMLIRCISVNLVIAKEFRLSFIMIESMDRSRRIAFELRSILCFHHIWEFVSNISCWAMVKPSSSYSSNSIWLVYYHH